MDFQFSTQTNSRTIELVRVQKDLIPGLEVHFKPI